MTRLSRRFAVRAFFGPIEFDQKAARRCSYSGCSASSRELRRAGRRSPCRHARGSHASERGIDARTGAARFFWRSIMVAGVVLWVALAVIFPTVVVPAAQHAVEHTIRKQDRSASAPGASAGGGAPAQPASPDGGDSIGH
nr:hypothetical protein [Burkholderia humptydooensis]